MIDKQHLPNDKSVLDSILQHANRHHLSKTPALHEVEKAIHQLKNTKATGVDGIPAEALKYGREALLLRFRKEVRRELCNVLRQDLELHTRLRSALTIETNVTIALNFFATGTFESATADISNISQFCAQRSIQQVTNALYRRRVDYISFLMRRDKQVEWQTGFAHIAGFPRGQDAIECTHVGLRAPQHHPEIFVNHKGFHSLNVQFVCDHKRCVLAVDARYSGRSPDSFILCQTSVPALFIDPNHDCGWLLGDKGCPLSTWLQNPRTAAEHAYNDAHSGTRCIIEHCIGIFKQSFHCLDRSGGGLQYTPERVSIFVVVCCMLHNLALMRGQPLKVELAVPPDDEKAQEEEEEEEDHHRHPARRCHRQCNPAREVQTRLIAARFT
uniref:putative nuclease HARBI1 n=1 Tax=Pristiophorus japonicus TaxID=55135 RepID=UPI00398F030B